MVGVNINKHSVKYLILYFSITSALELLAYGLGGIFSIAAAYIWLFSGLFWLGYFLVYAGMKLIEDLKHKKYYIFCFFLILIVYLFSFIGNISFSDINPDSAQQVAAGLNSYYQPDFNYTGTAFLDYPNRQYIIAAFPAFLFGRSVWSLHAGFGILFLIGLSVFFINLREWLIRLKIKEEYALLPCFALIAFPFIVEYYMNFEQAIIPVSLTLLGIGLSLQVIMDNDLISFLAISWTGCLMADSYTPTLASMGLITVFLVFYALKLNTQNNDSQKNPVFIASLGCAANIISFFLANYFSGISDKITELRSEISPIKAAICAWKDFFTDANVRFLGIFGGIVIVYLLLSLTFRLKIHDFFISMWVLGVVFFSDYMIGYTAYDKAWVMQRNMIIIPVIVFFIFNSIMVFFKKHSISIHKPIQIIIILFFLSAGMFNSFQPHRSFKYFSYVQPMKYAIDYIEESLKEYDISPADDFNLIIYTDNILQSNISDYASFFFPNAETFSNSDNIYDIDPDTTKPCFFFAEDLRLQNLIPDSYDSKSFIRLKNAPMSSQTYRNLRYDSEITWYRKVLIPD